jgi:alkaline phosphatase D
MAVEVVTPSVTSPSGFGAPDQSKARVAKLRAERPHLRYVDGDLRGYMVLDVTSERAQADWYYVPTIAERNKAEQFGKGLVTAAGSPHLTDAATPAPAKTTSAEPAP